MPQKSYSRRRCSECHQRIKPKRKPIKKVQNGVRVYPDGRERCLTRVAWNQRREEAWQREEGFCGHCQKPIEFHEAEIHHLRKRSLGRDDRLSNLIALCSNCHREAHA